MRIFDLLSTHVPKDAVIEDVSIGIFWTAVISQYGCGISATAHRWCADPPGAIIPEAGHLKGMPIKDVLYLYESGSLSARALACASLSASFHHHDMTGICWPGKAQDLLEKLCNIKRRHIALIGHFHFADALRNSAHQLDIFELENRCESGDIPNTCIPEKLPEADIVVMTSSTLLTHSAEEILKSCNPDAFKMIVGPTVPIHPELWKFGFDAICGSIVTDSTQVMHTVREGGNHKQITGCIKVNYLNPEKDWGNIIPGE